MAVRHTEAIAEDVERVLGASLPAIDLVDVRIVPGGVLRVLIDHPDGVDHERCAEVGRALSAFRERYALEVSSPGIPRPLTKPAHYERFRGRRGRSAPPCSARRPSPHPRRVARERRAARSRTRRRRRVF